MKAIILSVLLLLNASISFGQINQTGLPLIRNFIPEEYDASDQNYAAIQDHRGIMYFGNNDRGVLEYDGKTWRKIPVPHNARVRSLGIDSLGTIYVGTIGEFGYLTPDPAGKLVYKSLLPLVQDTTLNIADIYKINTYKGNIIFFSQNYLFQYNGKNVKVYDINPTREYFNLFSFTINNRFYFGSWTLGLRELVDTNITIAPNGEFFKNNNIFSMTAHHSEWAKMITTNGIYLYHQETGVVKKVATWNDFYRNHPDDGAVPYHSIDMGGDNIGVGFLWAKNYSFAVTDSLGLPSTVLNADNGLQDETVTYLNQTTPGKSPVWICTNIGITRADFHSQIRRFSEESGLRGAVMSITRYKGKLFVATGSGVFYKTKDKQGFTYFKQLINASAWTFLHFIEPETGRERLLIGTEGNIYEVDENLRVTSISQQPEFKDKITHIGMTLHQSKFHPEIVYIGWNTLAAMKWEDGMWKNLGRIKWDLLRNEYRGINSNKPNELWLTTNLNGITRVTYTDSDTIVDNFGTEHGLPGLKDNLVLNFKGELFFATQNGIYKFDDELNKFHLAKLPSINTQVEDYGISRAIKLANGYALACYKPDGSRWVETLTIDDNGNVSLNRKPFNALPAKWTGHLYADSKGILWVGISTELFSFNQSINRNYDEKFKALIRRVTTKNDSILFNGAFSMEIDGALAITDIQSPKHIPTLPFRLNRLVFDVAATYYEKEDQTEFSYILEGQDKEWTRWETNPLPIYNYLTEGSYVFKVKARNIYGVESNIAQYSFSITPPWYRSIVAIIAYVLLLAGFIWAIVVLNTRRLIAEKERLEQIVKERTAEVVAQKEEIEEQRDKIFEQNEEIKSSINYASRIQGALLTPIETINEIFDDYFILFLPRDIVSGDFYWHTQVGNRKISVVADCTGHGVPGGFMSMLGIGFLTQIVAKDSKLTASQILDQLRDMIIVSLHQTGKPGESKDGMDLALYIVDTDAGVIEFSGANNPLVMIRNDEIIQYKGDKMPIGIHVRFDTPFTNNIIEYQKGDVIYTFSDGYPDQFGGPDERKFMIKNLKDKLLEIHKKPTEEQREILLQTLVDWQGDTPRIDDVVLMGLRL